MISAQKAMKIHRLAQREWARRSRDLGVSQSEFEYLGAILAQAHRKFEREGDHGQHLHDIVAELGVTKASASAMVGKLEGRGLLRRFPCMMDARAYHIILTDAGRDLLTSAMSIYEAVAEAANEEQT